MKTDKIKTFAKLLAFFGCAQVMVAVATEPTEPIVGDYEVTVSSGTTETWSGAITGTGRIVKNGSGILVLANAANTFSGGIQINDGIVRIDAAGAIGTGAVTLTPAAVSASNICQLFINCSGTFNNAINQTANSYVDYGQASDNNANLLFAKAVKVTFNGNITSAGDISIRGQPANTSNSAGTGPTVIYNGDITALGKTVLIQSYGSPKFYGKIRCDYFAHNNSWSGGGRIYLYNAENKIGVIRMRHNNLTAAVSGALGGARFIFAEAWGDLPNQSTVAIDGTSQLIRSIDTTSTTVSTTPTFASNRLGFTASTPATLTLTGNNVNNTSKASINGDISLVCDAQEYPTFTQTITDRVSAMSGTLTVKKGTIKVAGFASFKSVPSITVENGGTLDIQSTAEGVFSLARAININGGVIKTTNLQTFPEDGVVALSISDGGTLSLPEDCVLKVNSLTVNGQKKSNGSYGAEIGVVSGSIEVNDDINLTGELVINIAANTTNEIPQRIVGEGSIVKSGAGCLKLTNQDNAFSGGIVISDGNLLVSGTNTLGSGRITINSMTAQLRIVGNAKFDNEITIANTTDDENSAAIFVEKNVKESIIGGNITLNSNAFIRHDRFSASILHPAPGPVTIFEGEVKPGVNGVRSLGFRIYGDIHMKKKINASIVHGVDAHSAGGKLYLYSAENDWNTLNVFGYFVVCMNENVLTNKLSFSTRGWQSGGSRLDMNGFNQEVKSISYSDTTVNMYMQSADVDRLHTIFSSKGNPTLTISGELLSNSTDGLASIDSNINLCINTGNNPQFTQRLSGRASLTTGNVEIRSGGLILSGAKASFPNANKLIVSENGTLSISGSSAAFANLKEAYIDGTVTIDSAAASPFVSGETILHISENAVINLPESITLLVNKVYVGQNLISGGRIDSARVPQIKGAGAIVTAGIQDANWIDSGDNKLVTTAANWDGGQDVVDSLMSGAIGLNFANAGEVAEINGPMSVLGVGFDAENGFKLKGVGASAALEIGGNGLSVEPSEVRKIYEIDGVAINQEVDATWNIPSNQVLRIKDGLNSSNKRINVNGVGTLELTGTNVIDGQLRMTRNVIWPSLTVSGLITTSHGVDLSEPSETNNSLFFRMLTAGSGLPVLDFGLGLNNAIIEKPIYYQQLIGTVSIWSGVNTTNEIRGKFKYANAAWIYINAKAGSEISFRGGLEAEHSFRNHGLGTIRLRDRPCKFTQYAGLNPKSGTVSVETTGNYFKAVVVGYSTGVSNVKVKFTVDGAMTNGVLLAGYDGGYMNTLTALPAGSYFVDLTTGTTQKCDRLALSSRSTIMGEYPSMLEVAGDMTRETAEGCKYGVWGKVVDGVGFHMKGTGTLVISNNTKIASCGDLKVSSGAIEIADGTSWATGTNVTVVGTGALKVAHSRAINRKTNLIVADDGRLEIPAGVQMTVKHATVNGLSLSAGIYNKNTLDAIDGEGELNVRGDGLTLIFR